MKRILLIDDHTIVRAGIRMLLKSKYAEVEVAEAENEVSAYKQIELAKYDLIIMDLNMPESDPNMLLYNIFRQQNQAKVIILTMNEESIFVKRFFKLGVKGFIQKTFNEQEILLAIDKVLHGDMYLSANLRNIFADSVIGPFDENPFEKLSQREFQIAQALVDGKTISEIATLLNIHYSTVATYKTKMFVKLGIDNNLIDLLKLAKTYNFSNHS